MEQAVNESGLRVLGAAEARHSRRLVAVLFISYSEFADPFSLVVDNHRVLHGRSAFTGKRRMCGAYIGVDEYKSKLAVLTEKFSSQKGETGKEIVNGRSVWSPTL